MLRRVLLAAGAALALGGAAEAQAAKQTVAQKMVSIARAELAKGVREVPDGSNRGTRIRMYGQSTSPRFYPAPWCAYFVSYVARRGGRPLGPSGNGFGYVPYIKAWATKTGRWRKQPKSGDLVMFPQHVGLVERVYRNGTLTTIEGNSSNRVARRWRRWKDASGYVRVGAGGKVERPGASPKPVTKPQRRPSALAARISVYPKRTVAVGQLVGFSANDSSGDIARYRWDLDGDGKFDDAKGDNAERRYARAGDVQIGLRITGRNGKTATARVKLEVRENKAPVAKLDLPRTVRVGQVFTAKATRSSDPDGKVVRYEWDADGDGLYHEAGSVYDTYFTAPGVHAIGLRVTDDRGAVTETVGTVEVTHKVPVAKATGPRTVGLGKEAAFDGSKSYDPDGEVAEWRWDFDGDGAADAEGPSPRWRFTSPGARKVRLVVRDAFGAEDDVQLAVDVTNAAPVPVLGLPARPVSGEDLVFDAGGSSDPDSPIAKYEWDFDLDGRYDATGERATWRFAGVGTRKVRLRVTDEWGAWKVTERSLTLQARPSALLRLVTASPLAGVPVTLTPSASADTDGSVDRLEWDFTSDGVVDRVTTSKWTTVTATWPKAGVYAVTLTVVDDDGLRDTTQLLVTVR